MDHHFASRHDPLDAVLVSVLSDAPGAKEDRQRLDPERLLRELNLATRGVDAASTKLADLTKRFENSVDMDTGEITFGVGDLYEIAFDEELNAIYCEYEDDEKRPPAEDIRTARARIRLRKKDPDLVARYKRTLTEMKALQTWISSQKQVISGKQSVLNGLRDLGA